MINIKQLSIFSAIFLSSLSPLLATDTEAKPEVAKEQFFLPPPTSYRYIEVKGHKIFYREAGEEHKKTIVLLHGYPSSSHSYRNLIPMLATHYHVIAPDNLGSGYSDHPDPEKLDYSFELLAEINNELLNKLGVKDYVMYMQDFGAPVGYRMMMKDPKRISTLIVQNANAYLDGLTEKRRAFFRTAQSDTSKEKQEALYKLTSPETIINGQYLYDIAKDKHHTQSPDAWTHDLAFLRDKKDRLIQVALFRDYNNNLLSYPAWQKMLRETQPPTLIVWGAKDEKFNHHGARAYLRDLPKAELHLLDAGHFAAEEKTRDIARLILNFLHKKFPSNKQSSH